MKRRYPFKNLVFKGGGVKGFAYIGALEALEEYKVLPQIERVAGNSAGSITATLVCFRKNAKETGKLLGTMDLSSVASLAAGAELDDGSLIPRALWERGEQLRGGMDALNRLRQNYGLFSGEYMQNWLEEVITEQCNGDGRATFGDFQEFGFRDLHIVATNISNHTTTEFSAMTTPDVSVADATIASCAIPFFYQALQFDGKRFGQGDYYVDGGVLTNYPLNIFDKSKYKKGNRQYDQGINWETLGFRLYTPRECRGEIEPITSLPSYIKNLYETIAVTEDRAFENNLVDRLRTINISNCCVSTIDFSVKPGELKYNELIEAGRSATVYFLENYQSPKSKIADLKSIFDRLFWR